MKKVLDDFSLILRGIKVLSKMSPFNLSAKILKSLCDAALPYVNLYMSALIINALIGKKELSEIILYVIVTSLINLLLILISKGMDSVNYVKFQQFYLRYNMSIGEKALSLDYSKIEDPYTNNNIKNIDDAMKIGNYGLIKLHSRIPLFTENFFKVCFSIGLTISVVFQKAIVADTALQRFANTYLADGILGLCIIATAVSYIVSNTKIASKSYNLLGILSKRNRLSDYYMNQYLDGHKAGKDIRLYKQDLLIIDELNSFGKDSSKIVNSLNSVTFKNNLLVSIFNTILNFYTYFYVCLKSMAGVFGVGSIMKYSGAVVLFSGAFSGMMDAFSQLRSNSKYLRDYFNYMDIPESTKQGNRFVDKDDKQKCIIRFENVSFKYPGTDHYALKNINIIIETGDKIAVVGKNGSGKTTMIKLLCRLYKPIDGKITLNDVDIYSYNYQHYLSMLSVVFQDFKIFSFTLGQNVAANIKYDAERVYYALSKSGFIERISTMPKDLETIIYKDFAEDGVEISGGEAQKIALARALYKDAPLVILDEPTAALDPVAEYEIYSRFNDIVDNKTVIYISHRLSSCRFCDKIFVFDYGEVVQQGNHDTLLQDISGKYYELWNAQSKYYE